MTESKIELWKRKIANGKRKQAEKILQEKLKVWDALKAEPKYKLRGKWTVDILDDIEIQYSPDTIEQIANTLREAIDNDIIKKLTGQSF